VTTLMKFVSKTTPFRYGQRVRWNGLICTITHICSSIGGESGFINATVGSGLL
jgi:hypothetical protein